MDTSNQKPSVPTAQSSDQTNIKLKEQLDSVYELHGQARLALRRMFESMDLDNSGKISATEVQALLKIPIEEAKQMIAQIDNNSDYEIDFNEFVQLMTTKGTSRISWIPVKVLEEYQTVFTAICAKHGDEKNVTVQNLAHNLRIPAHQLQGYLKGCDDVRKYTIDFDTFVELMIDPRIQLGNRTGSLQKFEAIGECEEEEEAATQEQKSQNKLKPIDPNVIQKLFELASDSSKTIDLKRMCQNLGATEEQAKNMIRSADVDGDGEINFDEYKQVINASKDYSIWIPTNLKDNIQNRYKSLFRPVQTSGNGVPFSEAASNLQLDEAQIDEWRKIRYPQQSSMTFEMFVSAAVELSPQLVFSSVSKKKACCLII